MGMEQTLESASQLMSESQDERLKAQQARKNRLMVILSEGLPTLPNYAFELNSLLMSPSVDLRKVSTIIRQDPVLSSQVIRLVNSALFGIRRQVVSIPEAAVLLGTERLRTLVLTCSVMEFAGRQLPAEAVEAFWSHSLMVALLSERIARWTEYFEREQAYLAGLLHDLGQLPLWMVALEDRAGGTSLPENWQDNLEAERSLFGLDHCEVGRRLGAAWKFFPSLIDVFENHHNPEKARQDPYLVRIAAAADQFSQSRSLTATPETRPTIEESATEDQRLIAQCLPHLCREEQRSLIEMLDSEYIHLLPSLEFRAPQLPSGSRPGQARST